MSREIYPYTDGMGGIFHAITHPFHTLKSVVGWVAGGGNTPGTPETREYGYDRQAVADAVAARLQQPVNITAAGSPQGTLLLLGGAGLAAALLLGGKKKSRRK